MRFQFFIFTVTVSKHKWNACDIEKANQYEKRQKQLKTVKDRFRDVRHV
ncbi:YrzI family small protein [Alkalihalobacterium bogoriense]|nr:YrzI family small protein [Alkalihalobacterium bogoriense]